ncbi:MAG: hypothetical protein WBV66_01245, partial [Pseudolabrys sp.]
RECGTCRSVAHCGAQEGRVSDLPSVRPAIPGPRSCEYKAAAVLFEQMRGGLCQHLCRQLAPLSEKISLRGISKLLMAQQVPATLLPGKRPIGLQSALACIYEDWHGQIKQDMTG